ncbi:MAG: acyl-CoA dehydrogenase family protein [Deltaproteobacteria bacterium]|nr:acyl-CoA dehydrogenase family protein [Deltaproteobacteria bacterium]
MDFRLTEEQEIMRDSLRKLLQNECSREYIRECDEQERFPKELFAKMAEAGWMGLSIPPEYGGAGGKALDLVLFIEELARHFEAAANIYYTTTVIARGNFLSAGTDEQKNYYLPRLASGESLMAFSLSEPNSGTDAASLTCSAVPDGDNYIINGQKIFCSCAQIVDHILLMTRTSKESKRRGITMFILDVNTPGVTIRNIKKLGLKPMDLNEIFLDDVVISKDNILGQVNEGWTNALATLEFERCCLTAINVGAAQAATDLACAYAKERRQFGQPIAKFQLIKEKLARMQMEVDATRYLLYRAAWMVDQGLPTAKESCMAKLHSSNTYMDVARDGMQIMAGYGFSMEYDMQRHYRDAKLSEFGGGTSELMHLIIAGNM